MLTCTLLVQFEMLSRTFITQMQHFTAWNQKKQLYFIQKKKKKDIQSKKDRNFKLEEFQYLPKYAVYVWFNLDLVTNVSNLGIR